ncbi:MAG: SDR family oxidoreductase [Leptolyngbyaceae bacterium]|nr:SDR family oxidoreductase [Leptolyngbyaceae bacterium]
MYLVTGATGGLGRRIVKLLREREQSVRALVRLNSRYGELEYRGAEILIGDLRRDRDIARACQGVQYVISAHGSNASGDGDAQAIDYQANIELIDQAKAVGVQHFVFISVLGADRGYDDAPVFKAKYAVERYLQQSGLNYTILRPSGFASNLLPLAERFRETGVYLLVGDPQSRASIVSTDDLARIAVESVTIPAAHRQVLNVGGPEILQRREIPEVFSRVFNREPILINPPLLVIDGIRSLLGWFNPPAQTALGTLRTLLANEFFCTTDEILRLESIFQIKMESLEHFLRRYFNLST